MDANPISKELMKDNQKEKELIADRLKAIRESTGLDQIKFAEMIEVPRQTVSKIETGRQEVSPRVLREIYNRLGVSPEYLLGLREDKKQDFNKLKSENDQLRAENDDYRRQLKTANRLIEYIDDRKEVEE